MENLRKDYKKIKHKLWLKINAKKYILTFFRSTRDKKQEIALLSLFLRNFKFHVMFIFKKYISCRKCDMCIFQNFVAH